MSCFPCFQKNEEEIDKEQLEQLPVAQPRELDPSSPDANENSAATPADGASAEASAPADKEPAPAAADGGDNKAEADAGAESENSEAKTYNFRELASATKNFKQESLIGESGFGKLFKGTLPDGQVVAVKRLDRTGAHDSKEFSEEVMVLTLFHHPNLLNLVGYCADGEQRLLVYEYVPNGCLQDHLFDLPEDKEPIDWLTRMKIASGVAQGLEYLHEKANPPIIYRDLKSSSILLDQDFNPKLSDYGLAKLEGGGNNSLLAGVMGSGYSAPEYERTGELTLKSDVYSFGVVLLELLSGRRAVDPERPLEEQNLVDWAQPIFRDPKRFPEMADPLLKKAFPMRSLNQAVGVAAMCLQEEASVRPEFGDVIAALSFLAVPSSEPLASSLPDPESQPSEKTREESSDSDSDSESDHGSEKDDNGERLSDHEDGNGSSSSDEDDDEGEEEKKSVKFKSKSPSINSRDESSSSSEDENDLSTEKAAQESDPIDLRNNNDSSDDEDSDKLSFCYSVNASINMRSHSISESNDGGSPKSNLRQESSLKSENNRRSFGSYSGSSDEGSDNEEKS